MAELKITHHKKKKCISFVYDNAHRFNIFDVEENSGTLELFGRLQYALENNLKLTVSEAE